MKYSILTTAALLISGAAWAQGTLEDYNRAYGLREKYSPKSVYYSNVNPQWIEGTDCFWYIRNTPEGEEYVKVDASEKKRALLFDSNKLSESLAASTSKEIDPMQLPIRGCRVSQSLDTLRFVFEGKRWCFDITHNKLTEEGNLPAPGPQRHWMERDDEKEGAPVTSPDGKYVAFIKNDNVCVRNIKTGEEKQLSQDGTMANYYSSYIYWSPDSKYVASCRIRPTEKRYVYYVESSPADQLQPKLHKQEYAKPGDELPFKVPCIFGVEDGKRLIPSTELFSHQYELYGPIWNNDSKGITFEYNERGHKVYRVLEMSVTDGSVRPLIEEKEEKYVNYPRIYRYYLNDLYLYDRATASPINQITKGEWYVREVQYVDEANQQIYFSANGVNKDEDPYLIHYYRIGFDGKGMKELTPEEGMHKAWYSSDHKYLVDVYSKVDQAPVAVLRNAENGKVMMELEKADISKLIANGWKAPEVFAAKGRDGKTDMWGIVYRPSNFDASKKYPVIEYIYSGPGDQYVPKTFSPFNGYMSAIAELGFIVVQVDGMTTSFRSKEFEEVRVGIFGCSAGGQEALNAVLMHPEFYKAAYSACGCHDNRMDKIWWNELWMGYPIDDSYKECSNVENAHLLTRPLMLVVGELDDNVDPASTMQVVNALIKANKDFELVVVPGAHHTMGEAFGEHKRYDFFVRHLMGVNPPAWSDVKTGK